MSLSGGSLFSGDWPLVTITYNLPDPIEFSVTDRSPERERRVLISNVRRGEYPDPHFQGLGAQDAAVPMSLRTRDASGHYQSGMTVYLRVVDPADPSAYMNIPQNVLARAGDNVAQQPAILDGPMVTALGTNFYTATSGSNGLVDFTLRLPQGVAAGDNYRVEASYDPGFSTGYGVWQSGLLTAWKRIFVEKRQMAQNGLFLADDAPAGANFIIVRGNRYGGTAGNDRLSRNDRILLVHAPDLSRNNALEGYYMEAHTILDVTDLGGGRFRVDLGRRQQGNAIVEALQRAYFVDKQDSRIGDAIVRIPAAATTAPVFEASNDLVVPTAGHTTVFEESFTEYIYLSATAHGPDVPMPYLRMPRDSTDQILLQALANKWSALVPNSGRTPPNHQLLIIAGQVPEVWTGLRTHLVAGQTSSWVFRERIDELATGRQMNPDVWATKTCAHEIAHQWFPNRPMWSITDHCPETTRAFDMPAVYCLLADLAPPQNGRLTGAETQRANGIARFHLLPDPHRQNAWHSEYFEIRRRPDPFIP